MTSSRRGPRMLSLPGLVAIIYYSVCGGPFGTEDVVAAAGPELALLGFLVMPLVWSVPEALVAAELATLFPSNSGYVTWVAAAFGPFWGFMEGYLSWSSGVVDTAIYPVLFRDYLKHCWPAVGQGIMGYIFVVAFAMTLTLLNYFGLNFVGWSAFAMVLFTLLPFTYIVPVGLANVEFEKLWARPPLAEVDWSTYLNVMFWNLNYWDTASTLAGEVKDPSRTFPLALLLTGILVVASYLFPLLVGIGMRGAKDWRHWSSGSLAEVGLNIGGPFMRNWVVGAAAVSNVGQFMSEQAANAFSLQGMAARGWLPSCFGHRSMFGTPTQSLALGLVIINALFVFDFKSIVDILNGLYCMAQVLEFAAFLRLRKAHADLRRPFRIPLRSTASCALLLLCPTLLCVWIVVMPIFTRDWMKVIIIFSWPVSGCILYRLLGLCRRRNWLSFSTTPPRTLEEVLAMQTPILGALSEPVFANGMEELLIDAAAPCAQRAT